MLDGAASALLGNLLGDALLVHATVDDSPVNLARVQALKEVGLALAVDETEALREGKGQQGHQGNDWKKAKSDQSLYVG